MPTVERICSEHQRKPVQSHITPVAPRKDNGVHFLKPPRTLCSRQPGLHGAQATHHPHPCFHLCPSGSLVVKPFPEPCSNATEDSVQLYLPVSSFLTPHQPLITRSTAVHSLWFPSLCGSSPPLQTTLLLLVALEPGLHTAIAPKQCLSYL